MRANESSLFYSRSTYGRFIAVRRTNILQEVHMTRALSRLAIVNLDNESTACCTSCCVLRTTTEARMQYSTTRA